MDARFSKVHLAGRSLLLIVVAGSMAPGNALYAQRGDEAAVRRVGEQYHAALAAGDSGAALALLADDVVILESGNQETRDEYRSHHLPGDMAFARAVPRRRGAIRVMVQGDVAWVTSTSVTEGEFRGRTVNSTGAELMVLSRVEDGWMIRAIHWSSRQRRNQ